MSLLVFYVFINTYVLVHCLSMKMLGPADIIYKSFEHCETKVTDIDVWLTQKKYNRTTNVLDITLISPLTIDDDLMLEVSSEVKKEGGYKPGSFYMKDPVCKVLSTLLGEIFSEFLKVAGTDSCPLPDGKYEIKNFYLNNEKMTVPQLYGEYRVGVKIFKDEKLKGCYFIFLDMVPKKE